ncbi:uncharacterized protein LOC135391927 [Ornithodoros turicata]|uniref:uncharacterized protein LOC135391927 n=1 Tax=Ornithodoros turicata TaxID=34597 RepID=UPI00313930BE
MPRDSLSLIRRAYRQESETAVQIPWKAIGATCFTVLIVIPFLVYFLEANPSKSFPPTSTSMVRPPVPATATMPERQTAKKPAGRHLPETDFDSIPALPAIPGVLLCGSNGGNRSLIDALTGFCTHAMFTGPMILEEDDYGRRFIYPHERQTFTEFLKVKEPVMKYLSLQGKLFEGKNGGELVAIISKFLSRNGLDGIQLQLQDKLELDIAPTICREFQKIHPGELHIILWISHTLMPQKAFFVNVTTNVEYIVFETQRLRADELHSLRFPNPYGPFDNSDSNDTFLAQQVAQLVPLRRHLEASNWCISMALGGVKCFKDALYSKILLVTGCDPVTMKEVCEQLRNHKSRYSRDAMSRYFTAGQAMYGYDDRDSLVEKLMKLLYQYPGFCISAYDVEYDDTDNFCHDHEVDLGTPLLRVLSQLVSARSEKHGLR